MDMRIFPVNEIAEKQIEVLLSQIKHLRNGDTAKIISGSGAQYRLNFGVMLVHLRQMSKECPKDNELACRLWFREIRETMVIATMVAVPDELDDVELNRWGQKVSTVELAEQLAMNLLGRRSGSEALLLQWLKDSSWLLAYAAAMAIGWQYRFLGEKGFGAFQESLPRLGELSAQHRFIQPVGHALKMAAGVPAYRPLVVEALENWKMSSEESTRQVASHVALELEGFSE